MCCRVMKNINYPKEGQEDRMLLLTAPFFSSYFYFSYLISFPTTVFLLRIARHHDRAVAFSPIELSLHFKISLFGDLGRQRVRCEMADIFGSLAHSLAASFVCFSHTVLHFHRCTRYRQNVFHPSWRDVPSFYDPGTQGDRWSCMLVFALLSIISEYYIPQLPFGHSAAHS